MNPLAEKAVKEAYETIEHIKTDDTIEETYARRMYVLGVINTLWKVKLITLDEFIALDKERETTIPYPSSL